MFDTKRHEQVRSHAAYDGLSYPFSRKGRVSRFPGSFGRVALRPNALGRVRDRSLSQAPCIARRLTV